MIANDSRQVSRANVDFPVTIQIDAGSNTFLVARAVNISVNGILLHSFRRLPINVPLVLHFPFEWQRAFVIVKAVYCYDNYYGCEFIDLPRKVYEALDRVLLDYFSRHSPKSLHTLWETLN